MAPIRREGSMQERAIFRLPSGRAQEHYRFCPKGHDKLKTGITGKAACMQCIRDHRATVWQRRRATLRAYKIKRGCDLCGYRRSASALEFHHRDPKTKRFSIGGSISRSRSSMVRELRKCIVLCRNCHAEIHAGEVTI